MQYPGGFEPLSLCCMTVCQTCACIAEQKEVYFYHPLVAWYSDLCSADTSSIVTVQQLHAPYGGSRCTNGSMPTSQGFTGQRADSASSGLDYYGARYYDPVLGQFASADTAQDGLNRYGYVHGNPTTLSDPSGHVGMARWRGSSTGRAPASGAGCGRSSRPGGTKRRLLLPL